MPFDLSTDSHLPTKQLALNKNYAVKQLPKEFEYLKDMYQDQYFHDVLVDKVKNLLKDVVKYLESGKHSNYDIQQELDKAIMGINVLQEEFEKNGSEIETGARESIGETIDQILKYFEVDIDIEEAMRERDW